MDENTEPTQINDPQIYATPLHIFAEEVHEVFEELKAVGFSDVNSTQIVAHMLMYGVTYRDSNDNEDDEDDEDNGISP